jgi:hypothetical protein
MSKMEQKKVQVFSPGCEAVHHLPLVVRLRMSGAVPQPSHMPSQHAQPQLSFRLYIVRKDSNTDFYYYMRALHSRL